MRQEREFDSQLEKNNGFNREQELTQLGFEKLGNTNLYSAGAFVIDIHEDGTPEMLVHYSFQVDPSKIAGINIGTGYFDDKKYQRHETDTLQLLFTDGKVMSVNPKVGSTGLPNVRETRGKRIITQSQFAGMFSFIDVPLPQQLAFAGFVEIDKNIFECVLDVGVDESDLQTLIITLDEEGHATRMVKSATHLVNESLHPESRFSSFVTESDNNYPYWQHSKITVKDHTKEYVVASDQYGRGGAIVLGTRRLLTEIPPTKLGLKGIPGTPWKEQPHSGFMEGMNNTDEEISNLKEINGMPIKEIEELLRSENDFSAEPWLSENQSIIERLLESNRQVREMGLSHQQVAAALQDFITALDQNQFDEFIYYGRTFEVGDHDYDGFAGSEDLARSSIGNIKVGMREVEVTNVETGENIIYDVALAEMVRKYGYYGPFSPNDLFKVFDFFKQD